MVNFMMTVPRQVQAAGYVTGHFGKWHLGLRPEVGPRQYGFDASYGYLHGQIDQQTLQANVTLAAAQLAQQVAVLQQGLEHPAESHGERLRSVQLQPQMNLAIRLQPDGADRRQGSARKPLPVGQHLVRELRDNRDGIMPFHRDVRGSELRQRDSRARRRLRE